MKTPQTKEQKRAAAMKRALASMPKRLRITPEKAYKPQYHLDGR